MTGSLVPLVLAALLLWDWRVKRRFLRTLLAEGYQAQGTVREYSQPDALTPRSYPYVEYLDATGHVRVQRLEYPKKKDDTLAVGQIVDIVSHRGHLYYLTELEQGLSARIGNAVFLVAVAAWWLWQKL
ncbi:hypothetical protein EJV47_10940 [Hymenobacter gummosus]|uniref:DUF3592 domain-containing protein n=1 Tax=Hymenobacter gummosus TaxID=1776032 RepID=A0A3S0H5M3_9BACT|nr:hypothetical protein [Hymenobacter gummosus]RTQ50143.1 hypothetical protein EJV47_10940 [Hymenobacter gummosus]